MSTTLALEPPISRQRTSLREHLLHSVLSRAGSFEHHLYDIARRWVSEVELAAPWERLYDWPGHPQELAGMATGLVAAIDQLPALLRAALNGEAGPLADQVAAERVVGRLLQVLSMSGPDVEKLRQGGPCGPPAGVDPEAPLFLRELIGEVKGKHCDALIGSTAACIAGDGTDPLQIEHVLFPERSQERRAARSFLSSLRDIASHLDALAKAKPFASWIAAWRAGRRIDRYALVPLTQLRGDLGTLLDPRNRRALHLPDFYQLCRREARLSEAVGELERLHRKTWRQSFAPVSPETCKALVARTLEVAAILDVESLLSGLIGGDRIRGLRGRADVHVAAGATGSLRQLLHQDDLRTLIGFLRGSMSKRGSLQQRPPAALPAAGHLPLAARDAAACAVAQ